MTRSVFHRPLIPGHLEVVALMLSLIALAPTLLSAQAEIDPTEGAVYQFGPFAFSPALVFSTGYDTNVYREAIGFADVETFAVPQIEGWWTHPGFRISGHAALERVNFRQNVGATNGQTGFQVARINSLVKPFVAWNRRRTNASPTGFEIGYKSLRLENDWSSGLGVALSPRTHVRGLVRFVRTNWDADARYQASSLREKLNRDTLSSNVAVSYDLTPLTSIGATVDTQRDRFKFSSIRNGDSVRIAPVVEFGKPAWLFGNATVGYERFRSPASGAADFNGVFAAVNLGYGWSDGTLLKLFINRDLQYSYDPALAYYVATGIAPTVARRLGSHWDLAAFGGRYLLDFRPAAGNAGGRPVEVVNEFGGAIAYRISIRTRIGATVERAAKTGSDGYHAVRVAGFLTYGSGRFQRLDRPTPFDR